MIGAITILSMIVLLLEMSYQKEPKEKKIVVHPDYWKYNRIMEDHCGIKRIS